MSSRPDDLVVGLSAIEARSFLGDGNFERLCSHFGAPVDAIKLRRASAIGKFVPFLTDYSLRTMQFALNDDFKGGQTGSSSSRRWRASWSRRAPRAQRRCTKANRCTGSRS